MDWNGTISLLIACIELILLVNLLALADKTKPNKFAILMIALLFVYQLLEFLMCHFGLAESIIAYLAFADISFLPPVGLYFVLIFLGYRVPPYIKLIFIPAVLFVIFYAFAVPQFKVVSCTVLYASYNYPLGTLYGAFYYLPVLVTMLLLFLQIKKEKEGKKTFLSKVLLAGYIFTSIPVILAFALSISGSFYLLSIIESIMCKFAAALAFSLAFVCLYGRTPAAKIFVPVSKKEDK
ncbi:MAG: hypothetical protein R6W90_13005 [Ignavibacteriaceae bacterium]